MNQFGWHRSNAGSLYVKIQFLIIRMHRVTHNQEIDSINCKKIKASNEQEFYLLYSYLQLDDWPIRNVII